MRWLKPSAALVLVLFAVPARAQDAAPQPTAPPAPVEAPPPPPPPPPPQVFDGEAPPPAVRPAPVPARRRPPVEQPQPTVGFGMELSTAGFASGELQGGLLLGVHTPGGSIFGARFDYRDQTNKLGVSSSSTTAFEIGLGARFPVVGSQDGFDLALAFDLGYLSVERPDSSSSSASKGTGFTFGGGPQLRYWLHPNVAIGYMAQFTHTNISVDAVSGASSSDTLEQSVTALVGAFTVTAGF